MTKKKNIPNAVLPFLLITFTYFNPACFSLGILYSA